jgi:dihydrodipicolinate synthase/N-acetylneuraminate lyase
MCAQSRATEEYEDKFSEFIEMCKRAKQEGVEGVMIGSPEDLGDNYEEVIQSLEHLAKSDLVLKIASPEEIGKA